MNRVLMGFAGLAVFCLLSSGMQAQPPGQDKDKGKGQPPKGGRPGQPGQPGQPGGFQRLNPVLQALDTDGDGELSADEIKNASKTLMKLDKNGDGKLSGEEIRPAGFGGAGGFGRPGGGRGGDPKEMIERFKGFDKNKDGKLSKDELPEFLQQQFERGDANKDGFLDEAEIKKLAEGLGGAGAGTRPGGRPGTDPKKDAPKRPARPDKD